jgi:hypothetical protein
LDNRPKITEMANIKETLTNKWWSRGESNP